MKQAKFALTAVAVLAVIGGALAFKASRGVNANIYTASIVAGKTYCSVPVTLSNTTAASLPFAGPTFTTSASFSQNLDPAPCPVITLRQVQ